MLNGDWSECIQYLSVNMLPKTIATNNMLISALGDIVGENVVHGADGTLLQLTGELYA